MSWFFLFIYLATVVLYDRVVQVPVNILASVSVWHFPKSQDKTFNFKPSR